MWGRPLAFYRMSGNSRKGSAMADQPDHHQRLNENGVSPVLMIAFHKHHFDGSSTSASPCRPRFCGFSWTRRHFSSCHPRFCGFSWMRCHFSSCRPRFWRFSWMRHHFSSCRPRFGWFSWMRHHFSSCRPRFGRVFMDEMSFFELPSTFRAVFMDGRLKRATCVFCKSLRSSVLAQMPAFLAMADLA